MLKSPRQLESILIAEAKKSKLDAVNECVMKLFFKKKYVIVKGKTAVGALKCIFRIMSDYSGKKSSNLPEDNLYLHFVKYFWEETRGFTFRVQLLAITKNAYDLLKTEQTRLWWGEKDPNCLNNTIDAYIPIYREETRSYGWLNTGNVLNFLKWKKKIEQDLAPANYETSGQIGMNVHS